MKNMKKLWALLLALAMCLSLAACGGDDAAEETPADDQTTEEPAEGGEEAGTESDLAFVQDKGTLVVGITEFEPMDYQNTDGEWIGFDADLAKAFAESLGVTAEFQLIDWDSKIMELDGKTIDVVWNGMTLTEDVKAAMECSQPYLINQQVVVVPADVADQYQTEDSLADLAFAVEIGSAGCEVAAANGYSYTEVADQATALLEVASGTADAAIIDSLMAGAMIGEGTSYADLTSTVALTSEEYGVGFRKGSDLVDVFNEFWSGAVADGTVEETAAAYGLQDAVILE